MALTLLRLARDRPGAEHTARLQARAGRWLSSNMSPRSTLTVFAMLTPDHSAAHDSRGPLYLSGSNRIYLGEYSLRACSAEAY